MGKLKIEICEIAFTFIYEWSLTNGQRPFIDKKNSANGRLRRHDTSLSFSRNRKICSKTYRISRKQRAFVSHFTHRIIFISSRDIRSISLSFPLIVASHHLARAGTLNLREAQRSVARRRHDRVSSDVTRLSGLK